MENLNIFFSRYILFSKQATAKIISSWKLWNSKKKIFQKISKFLKNFGAGHAERGLCIRSLSRLKLI